ncbi:MAG: hypothetical protein K9M44_04975 [Candidatus Pacebacteria bacterium]|nr:hypothetical protein [Candidatus Paceibacterota bacterium]
MEEAQKILLLMKRQKQYFWISATSIILGLLTVLLSVILAVLFPEKNYSWLTFITLTLILIFIIFFKKSKKVSEDLADKFKK